MTALHTEPQPTQTTRIREHAAHKLARLAPHYEGRAFLRAIQDGELPAPPIADLLGFDLRDVADDHVTFALEPTERLYNPIGSVHGGVAATLLDTAMGVALHAKLPQGNGYTTLDLNVRYLRAITVSTHTVLATGRVVHLGRRTAVAEAELRQESTGQLLATATSTLLVIRP